MNVEATILAHRLHRSFPEACFDAAESEILSVSWLLLATSAVREFVNQPAASATSLDYVKFQAMIKLAASAASPLARPTGSRLSCCIFGLR